MTPWSSTSQHTATAGLSDEALACGDDLDGFLPVFKRLGHPRPHLDVHAGIHHGHLSATQRTCQHQLVHVAQVADAEHLCQEDKGLLVIIQHVGSD